MSVLEIKNDIEKKADEEASEIIENARNEAEKTATRIIATWVFFDGILLLKPPVKRFLLKALLALPSVLLRTVFNFCRLAIKKERLFAFSEKLDSVHFGYVLETFFY